MKLLKKIFLLTFLLSAFTSLCAFAASIPGEIKLPKIPVPSTEEKNEDRTLDYRWVWLKDDLCVRFKIPSENITRADLQRRFDIGAISLWSEWNPNNMSDNWAKVRDTYTGKWSQSSEGIWSFEFDDKTIPVGVTKIDGVLYAFTGYGELKEGYEYYSGMKTAADGLVKADSTEFTQWLTTQYLPECTSHE
ncbi:hypothetical protein [Clostridium sp. E02]|uniref:hypothetical protein n=1 Tax=Clostridium sp. E02 TaxID=2487134 RepID=UPI000F540464|nr:hypothetical protein [Clostridium sp. E02]